MPRQYGLESVYWVNDVKVHVVWVTNNNRVNIKWQVHGKLSIYNVEGGTLLDAKTLYLAWNEHYHLEEGEIVDGFSLNLEKIAPIINIKVKKLWPWD